MIPLMVKMFESGQDWENSSIAKYGAMLCKSVNDTNICRDYDSPCFYERKNRFLWMGTENNINKEVIFNRSKY